MALFLGLKSGIRFRVDRIKFLYLEAFIVASVKAFVRPRVLSLGGAIDSSVGALIAGISYRIGFYIHLPAPSNNRSGIRALLSVAYPLDSNIPSVRFQKSGENHSPGSQWADGLFVGPLGLAIPRAS